MKNTMKKKLALKKETLRALQRKELLTIQGGTGNPTEFTQGTTPPSSASASGSPTYATDPTSYC
jgi:hypothetical protein